MIANLRRPELTALYACPACRGALDPSLCCATCGRTYETLDGRPILLAEGTLQPPQESIVLAHHARQRTGEVRRGLRGLADRFRDATTAKTFGDDRAQVALLVDKVRHLLPASSIVLEVGAGEQYYRNMLTALGELVVMDFSFYGPTDLVGDCHRLPIRDGQIDALCAIEVIEHLARPWVFFEEVARVLRRGGVFFGVTPQYCPTHGFPFDYFRYTRGGLESLASHARMQLADAWPIGGAWGTLLHWYWANRARENRLRRIPVVNLAYHVWFQSVARALNRLDHASEYGQRPLPQMFNDHMGWSFIIRNDA